jgi:hypothetical protein
VGRRNAVAMPIDSIDTLRTLYALPRDRAIRK